jgi:hypothetical protein
VIPRSVPATLAVYPLMKWYMACSGESLAERTCVSSLCIACDQ